MMEFTESAEATIATWQGMAPPNAPARQMAADLIATLQAFEVVRGRLRFEDEPASFTAALQATKE